MLTDEDIKRIGNEIVKRMTGVANIKKRRNRLKSEMYKPTVRYDFQDGIGDTYDLSDYSKEGPAVIDMTYDDLGYFYLIFDSYGVPHWMSGQSHMKTVEEMAEFLDENLWGEFTIIQL